MGSIHSQLLSSPKSVGGWGSAPDPPPPPNSEGERICTCQSDTPKGGAQFPSSPRAPETLGTPLQATLTPIKPPVRKVSSKEQWLK